MGTWQVLSRKLSNRKEMTVPEFDATITYRSLPGFSGYMIGSDGSIWSCRAIGGKSVRFLDVWHQLNPIWRQKTHLYGALYVSLRRDGQTRIFHVGVLVLITFVGPRPDGYECCHRDGNTRNNVVSNLRWGTPISNAHDRELHGRMPK